jgi:hypothetical protein
MVRLAVRDIGDDEDCQLLIRDDAVMVGIERPEVDVAFAGRGGDGQSGDIGWALAVHWGTQGPDETGAAPGEPFCRGIAEILDDRRLERAQSVGVLAVSGPSEKQLLVILFATPDLAHQSIVRLTYPDHEQRATSLGFLDAPAERRSIRLSRKRLTRRENSEAYRSEDRDDQGTCDKPRRARPPGRRHAARPGEYVRGGVLFAERLAAPFTGEPPWLPAHAGVGVGTTPFKPGKPGSPISDVNVTGSAGAPGANGLSPGSIGHGWRLWRPGDRDQSDYGRAKIPAGELIESTAL